MTQAPSLRPFDYFVIVIVLAVPVVIGIVYAVKDKKKRTRLEYLFGGQQMTLIPVTMSMFVTFQRYPNGAELAHSRYGLKRAVYSWVLLLSDLISRIGIISGLRVARSIKSAISLIGMPAEVYIHGSGMLYLYLGMLFCFIFLYFTFVPMIYPLEVTSIYEYLQLRFQSKAVRMLSTLIGCMQTIFYLSVTLLAPSLALQAVSGGMPMWMSILMVGGIGTVYTVIGGIKSVIWTDVFQAFIMFVGLFAIIIKGSIVVGGLDNAWSIADDGGRIKFDEFRLDPRVRMSVWGTVLGGIVVWMSTAFNQATLQRIRSLKSLRDAKMTYIVCLPLQIAYGIFLVLVGIVTYAYFSHLKCDPLKASHCIPTPFQLPGEHNTVQQVVQRIPLVIRQDLSLPVDGYAFTLEPSEGGLVQNANQIAPYFVIHAMDDLHGMPGLYMATLFCGSLSTISSGVNALAANTVEDFLERPLKNVDEKTATLVTKIAGAVHGILICSLAYGAHYLDGSVIQIGLTVFGALGTPILGMFLIGCAVPWANKYGAVAGGMLSLAFNLWISIGNRVHGRKVTTLPPASTDSCSYLNSTTSTNLTTPVLSSGDDVDEMSLRVVNSTLYGSKDSSGYGFFLYDISYEWYPFYGLVVCIIVGLAVSFCTKNHHWAQSSFNTNLMFPICRRFHNLESAEQSNEMCNDRMKIYIECN